MKKHWYEKGVVLLGCSLFGLFLAAGAGNADFVGIDTDGDTVCVATAEAGQIWSAGDVGNTHTFDVFMSDLSPLFSFGCSFCVTVDSMVTNIAFTYNSPSGWTDSPLQNSADNPGSVPVDPDFTSQRPNIKCWLAQSTDFNFATPMAIPAVIGTVQFEIAQEGPIFWIIDGGTSGYFSTGFGSGDFGGDGETCITLSPSSTEATSWGSVKQLFR